MQVSCVWLLCSSGASSQGLINAPGPAFLTTIRNLWGRQSHALRWLQNSQTLGVGEPAALPSKPPVALVAASSVQWCGTQLRQGHSSQPKYECHRTSKVCS
ncbi:hypothetical protein BDZ85DRAFT_260858 [Elsinoe ampelina]|uniref:Secreted protein n=1 Tax=Elsinoe ampelina TaxID=302913 RepID=A0A6A6GFA9_9PEZI|nr:hypothetical protein BDZ85DRAFT_260858 [Elsinoe ampelina]